jgi:hypothetical protein
MLNSPQHHASTRKAVPFLARKGPLILPLSRVGFLNDEGVGRDKVAMIEVVKVIMLFGVFVDAVHIPAASVKNQ